MKIRKLKYFLDDDAHSVYKMLTKERNKFKIRVFFLQMYGDDWFVIGILEYLETYEGQKYFYYFNHNSSVSLCGVFLNNPLYLGKSSPLHLFSIILTYFYN